jgi:putative component of membrane protein insertase Oxa1/YidC/SpoIIIJ protein YidD
VTTIGQRVVDGLVAAYQQHVSSGLNADNDTHCLYTPSCSAYARDALAREGALIGTLDAMGRLARCNRVWGERNREAFLRGWGEPGIEVSFGDASAKSQASALHEQMGEAAGLRAEGRVAEAEALESRARDLLRQRLHVAVEDRPGQHAQARFTVTLARSRHEHPVVGATPAGGSVRRVLSAVVGGVVGGVVGAVAEGLLTGLVLAPLAGTGRDSLRTWLEPRVGPQGAEALQALAARATRPAALARSVGGPLAGLAVGIPAGLVTGMVHGAVFGAFWGSRVGRAI